jgi:hypothetical protein
MTTTLQKKLEADFGSKLKLKINNNRSTMLSVKWEPDCTKVSLHKIFLDAPKNVMNALACYLKREVENIAPTVKEFIQDNLRQLDYTRESEKLDIYSRGHVYNLQKIYDEINREYFDSKLQLKITWFGNSVVRCRSRVTFGLYHDHLKLIKINRLLDNPSFPDYVVKYVVYHEMVHHVCPSYYDKNGIQQVHTKEFKAKEALYEHFELAQSWIKKNQANFFL